MDPQNMSPEEIMELQRKNCIFCKIIKKEIPSKEVYSDDKVSVILDINPAHEGHCLILPKQHYQILPQMPKELIGYMFIVAKKMSRTMLKSLGVQGTTIFVANGAIAGQKAPHFMIHVLPRKRGDMLFKLPRKEPGATELDDAARKLAARVSTLSGRPPTIKPEPKVEKPEPAPKTENTPKPQEAPVESKEIDLDKISRLFS